jgi:hypothetical protein
VGALQDEYLAHGRPLGASRVLWEIASDSADVRALRASSDELARSLLEPLGAGQRSRLVEAVGVVEPC